MGFPRTMPWLIMALVALASAAATDPDVLPREEILPTLPIVALHSHNSQCKEDSQTLLDNLNNSTSWATQMWDSSVKGAVGLLSGSVYQLGDFDGCVAVTQPVRAQYCLVRVTLSLRTAEKKNTTTSSVWDRIIFDGHRHKIPRDVVNWALCVPASCSSTDIETSLNLYLAATERNNSQRVVSVALGASTCQTNRQEEQLSAGSIAYCVVLALIVVVVVGSTVFDFSYRQDRQDEVNNLIGYLLCFSMRKNFSEIALSDTSDHSIDCVHGLRVISMYLIILYHSVFFSIAGPVQNFDFIERQYGRFYSIIIYKGDVPVDSFFAISGLLVAYILCRTLDKQKVNPLLALIVRYIRLTPVYMLVVAFYSTLLYHVGEGPMWNLVVGLERDNCLNNWWGNLLYINNYVKGHEICMIQSWFMPCVMHLSIVAFLVVPVMHKHPKTGMCIAAALIIASALVPFLVTLIARNDPLYYFYPENFAAPRMAPAFRATYIKSHMRAGSFFVGMATGYLLYRTSGYKKNYTWKANLGLVLSILVCCVSVLPAMQFYDPEWKYDALQAALYAGIHRIGWAVGLCGIIVATVFNKSSIVGAVLSWSPMIALGKLVYCQFLAHLVIQTIRLGSTRSPIHVNVLNGSILLFADVCWSLLIALAMYLTVEAPTRLIFKRMLLPRQNLNSEPKPEI